MSGMEMEMETNQSMPFGRPLYVMAKPAGPACNMTCRYCYYLDKNKTATDGPGPTVMSDDMLERFIKMYIESQTTPDVLFCWHGGEALLRPRGFYEKAMTLQQRYAGGRHIDNSIQTNGTLLDDDWCRFFRDNGWLVGVSVDGPREIHDAMRRTRGGAPTFDTVMAGIRLLQKYSVEWNAMAVVNSLNAGRPLEFYRFFRSIGARYLQFTPIVERRLPDGTLAAPGHGAGAVLTDESVSPAAWGEFLCRVFDEWYAHDIGQMFVQLFESTLARWTGLEPGMCSMAPECGHALVMEHNGDVYSCDHFVFPEYRLGNIRHQTLVEMMLSDRQQTFGAAKRDSLPARCRECRWLFACNGECPKNRFAVTPGGERGLNYLCEGYRRYFSHVDPYMRQLREMFG